MQKCIEQKYILCWYPTPPPEIEMYMQVYFIRHLYTQGASFQIFPDVSSAVIHLLHHLWLRVYY